jgi:hypothetical protein
MSSGALAPRAGEGRLASTPDPVFASLSALWLPLDRGSCGDRPAADPLLRLEARCQLLVHYQCVQDGLQATPRRFGSPSRSAWFLEHIIKRALLLPPFASLAKGVQTMCSLLGV